MSEGEVMTSKTISESRQFATFYLGNSLFGLDVTEVQEVTQRSAIFAVPLAPKFVKGLVNLRGQIATALGLRELFDTQSENQADEMLVVCRMDGNLVSLVVDAIGDVLTVEESRFEQTPDTIPANLKKYMNGIYKLEEGFLSVLNLERISKELTPSSEAA